MGTGPLAGGGPRWGDSPDGHRRHGPSEYAPLLSGARLSRAGAILPSNEVCSTIPPATRSSAHIRPEGRLWSYRFVIALEAAWVPCYWPSAARGRVLKLGFTRTFGENGKPSLRHLFFHTREYSGYAASSKRALSKSNFARPYIWRLISFSLLISCGQKLMPHVQGV